MQVKLLSLCALALLTATGCTSHYALQTVTRQQILIDNRYDADPNPEAAAFMVPYKQKVDSIMGPVVGETVRPLTSYRPESPLSNLLADIMVWAGKFYNERPDIGVYNMGGIRASLPAGKITYGDIVDIAPFENKICFVTLSGESLTHLFQNMALTRGEGVSRGVRLVITHDGRLVSASLNGKPIDPNAKYRIATIDYLAQGNDKMTAFKEGTDLVSPKEESNNSRYIIRDYFVEKQKAGEKIDSQKEGRIQFDN